MRKMLVFSLVSTVLIPGFAGDVVRVEDTAPCKGHITVVGDKPVYLMLAR